MLFSLIVPTLNREKEFDEFCKSMICQTYKTFELIIVDQNENDIVDKIVNKYNNCLKIFYIKSSKKGLSLNRNLGLKEATGDIVAFPDDDCEYKPDTLQDVFDFFSTTDYGLFTINMEDRLSGKKCFCTKKRKITYLNFLRSSISITIFVKRQFLYNFNFDERLGVGAEFGAGEESDLMLYLLSNRVPGFFDGGITVYHPRLVKNHDPIRAFNGGMGLGACFKKAITHYHAYILLLHYCWYVVRYVIAVILKSHKKYYYAFLLGEIQGFLKYK
ncbi:glycosyl transferase [Spirochaetia bacterium]|nr:glycosyl transferase [Spirochaetia bacterium]